MAFRKYARATLIKPDIHTAQWLEITAGRSKTASKVLADTIDPKQFMLSHVTIIASVDTEVSPEPLGTHMVDGVQVQRKYADWLVTPETSRYINNNNDCWERKLLLASYPTFVGGENYVEHVQIPELSKGKLLDAAARDIGDSIYVDLLVATNRKHADLITAIRTGALKTLSMGCQVEFTICTKCGNVAADETQLCNHIRYFKGNEFVDAMGRKRKIAELCGHLKAEPGSVRFIEASWVANPAFEGAVLREILSAEDSARVSSRMGVVLSAPARQVDAGALLRTAAQGQGQGQGFDDGMDAPAEAPAAADPVDKIVNDMADVIRERATKKVREDLTRDTSPRPDENQNNNLVKEAMQHETWREIHARLVRASGSEAKARNLLVGMILYKQGGWQMVRKAQMLTGVEMLALSRLVETPTRTRMAGMDRIYHVVATVGGLAPYRNVADYITSCQLQMGRPLTETETLSVVDLGVRYAWGTPVNNPSVSP